MTTKSTKKPARKRRAYHHGDLANALLDAADRLVAEKGPNGFSLREAARAVGVDPAASYRHYRDREAVLHALARRGFTKLAAAMREAAEGLRATSPEKRLVALGHAYVRFAVEHASSFRVMFGPTGVDARDHLLKGDYPDGIGGYDRLQMAIGAWADAEGLAIDLEYASLTLWGGVHGLACLLVDGALRPSDDRHRRRIVEESVRTMIAGLARRGRE